MSRGLERGRQGYRNQNYYFDWPHVILFDSQFTKGQYLYLNYFNTEWGGEIIYVNYVVIWQVIIGGAQEELSLQQLMEEVNQEVLDEFNNLRPEEEMDRDELAKKVHSKLQAKGESNSIGN